MTFIDSARIMASSVSSIVDNLAEGIHKIKYKNNKIYIKYDCLI